MECHCSSVRPRDRLDSVHQCAPVCLRMFSNKAPRVLRQEGVPQAVVAAATAQFGRRCPTASPGVQERTLHSFMLQCLYYPSRPFASTQYAHSPSLPLFIDFTTVFCSASRPPSLRELSSRDHPGHSSNELGAHPGYATPRSRQSFVPLHSPVSTRHRRHDNPTDPLQSHSEGMACAAVRLYR